MRAAKRSPKLDRVFVKSSAGQAKSVWNWVAFLRTLHSQGLLLINLDETGVPLFHGDKKGNVRRVSAAMRRTLGVVDPTQVANRHEMRGQATHVAIICDDASVQPHLPQVIIGDPKLLPAAVCRELQQTIAPNVHLLRLRSRWTDAWIMQAVLKELAASIRRSGSGKQPVLLWDTAPSHLHASLPALAKRLGIHLVLVPARTTWLLQPCDVGVFLGYKAELRRAWLDAKSASADGQLSKADFWRTLCNHVAVFMHSRDWSALFARTGFGASAGCTSKFIRNQLRLADDWRPDAPRSPDATDLQWLLPRNRTLATTGWLPALPSTLATLSAGSATDRPLSAAAGSSSGAASAAPLEPWPPSTPQAPPSPVPPREPEHPQRRPMTRLAARRLAEAAAAATSAPPLPPPSEPPPEGLSQSQLDGPISGRTRSRRSGSSMQR